MTLRMRRDAASLRRRAPARAPAVAWLAAAVLAAALPASAADLTGRAELTYGEDEIIGASSDYWRQLYTLTYRRQVTTPTSYQLSLRFRDDSGSTWVDGKRSDLHERLLEPSATLDHRLDGFGLALAYRRNDEAAFVPEQDTTVHRTIERVSGTVYLRPFEKGEVGLTGDRLAYSATGLDTLDQRAAVTFHYTSEALRLANEFRVQRTDDRLAQHSRVSIGPRVTAGYSAAFGGKSSVSAQYFLDYFLTEQDARASTQELVPVEVLSASGLYLRNNVPIDTPPMLSEPRLVDRVLDVSAGVNIGPGGTSFNNLGLDMGRFVVLDELRVHVRDAAGAPVAVGVTVTWTAYTSQDGLRWAPLDGAFAAFSFPLSAYVITFPATSARFFKVVNFGVSTVDCFVTELQPFVHELAQAKTSIVSSAVRQGLSVSLVAQPAPKVELELSGLLNSDMLTAGGSPRRWFTDATTSGTARFGPYGDFLYGVRQTFTLAREPNGVGQSSWTTIGSVRFQPIPTYDTTVELRVGGQQFQSPSESVRTTTTSAVVTNRFDVYETLHLGLGAGTGRQDFVNGARTDYVSGSGYAQADLTRDLWLRWQSIAQRTVSKRGESSASAAGFPIIQIIPYQMHTLELRFQPAQQLWLAGRVGYASSDAGSGIIESVQASWSPFPGGAVQLAFDYGQDVDPLTGRSYRRIGALPRWQINAHAQLQLSYNDVRGTGDIPIHQQNLFLTFALVM